MKGIDLLCASPASTAICVSTDHHAMVRHGGRKLDRHNPHLRDGRRTKATSVASPSSSSQLPPTKQPKHRHHQKSKKSSSSSSSSAAANNKPTYDLLSNSNIASPPGSSSRYLLSDSAAFYDVLSEFEPISALVAAEPNMPSRSKVVDDDEFDDFPATLVPSSSSSVSLHPSSSTSTTTAATASTAAEQVVVLRVSLHCKGCEGKVKKHISRMKGVTSFNIDFAMKKVTVVGDVTPLGVLASVSRVKRAQFWPPTSSTF